MTTTLKKVREGLYLVFDEDGERVARIAVVSNGANARAIARAVQRVVDDVERGGE